MKFLPDKIIAPSRIPGGLFYCKQLQPPIKKGASDGYRRPVLTSETTKRKKLSYLLLYNNLIEDGVQWMMDKPGYVVEEGNASVHAGKKAFCMPGNPYFYD